MLRRQRHIPDEAEDGPLSAAEYAVMEGRRSGTRLRCWAELAVVIVGCSLTGSKEPWALGVMALLVALNIFMTPPATRVPASIHWPLMFFLAWLLTAFLPLPSSA